MDHSPMSEEIRDAVLQDWLRTRQTTYVGIVGFTILIWDHLLTSEDEIELVWKAPKGIFGWLFLLNRYLTPLVFIVNLVAYNLPTWSETVSSDAQVGQSETSEPSAEHFVRYEGATTAIGIEVVGLMMLMRVFAMYKHQWAAIALAVILFLVWISVTAWLLIHAEPVNHSNGIHSCSMVFNSGSLASASAWLPLLYDTYVFGLTSYRTFPLIRNKGAGKVVRTLFAGGLLYYSVICAVNLVLTIMLVRAPEGVRNIAAQLELLLTVTMMSRITLNLKKQARHNPSDDIPQMNVIFRSTGCIMPTALRKAHISDRLQFLFASARPSRPISASPIPHTARPINFAQNPSLSILRPPLSEVSSASDTVEMSLISDNSIHVGHRDHNEPTQPSTIDVV